MTQTQTPPAGWYPDPAGGGGQRWWNGMAWSDHVQPAVAPAPVPPQAAVGVGTPAAAAFAPAATVSQGAVAPIGSGVAGAQYASMNPTVVPHAPATPPHAWAPMTSGVAGSRNDNQYAYVTFGFAAFYILLAVITHFVLIGVVPVLMAVRSLKAQEKLAPVAMGVAILTVFISFAVLAGH